MNVLRAPFHRTISAVIALEERERIDRIIERQRDVNRAYLFNYAMAAKGEHGDALSGAQRDVERAFAVSPWAGSDAQARGITAEEEQAVSSILRTMFRTAPPEVS